MTFEWPERSRIWLPCGRNWWKMWLVINPLHFLNTCIWDALSGNANRMMQSLNNTQKCSSHVFLPGATERLPGWQTPHAQTVGVVQRHERTCSKMRWAILWIGKQESWATLWSVSSLFLDDHQFKREDLETVGEIVKKASSRVLVLQVRKWMQIWRKVLLRTPPGWRTALQKV